MSELPSPDGYELGKIKHPGFAVFATNKNIDQAELDKRGVNREDIKDEILYFSFDRTDCEMYVEAVDLGIMPQLHVEVREHDMGDMMTYAGEVLIEKAYEAAVQMQMTAHLNEIRDRLQNLSDSTLNVDSPEVREVVKKLFGEEFEDAARYESIAMPDNGEDYLNEFG